MSSTTEPSHEGETTDIPLTDSPPVVFTSAVLTDLTAREREILELVTNGYSNGEISRMLFLSPNTVKTYVRSSYRKIGAEARSHAIVWGVRHGLLAGVEASADTP